MCLACLEYQLGKLTEAEFLKNKEEYKTEKHDQEAIDRAYEAIANDIGAALDNLFGS